ncbi:hypothetical protein J155_04472 [Xanthomonas citri pv. citri]|nr:hypothetical protein J151_04519 [Xanthomonas citri subsp. citri A306]AJY84395.1 hypothetical protein J159_04468 [Xanthomonas citri pv. citri]AJY88819.1 hypothetical protein J158_04470 [Xanthomonas citri subsp. citri UI6]AJY93290.1 hypothetical protein J169_04517 [Xanthomonas citri pv. citri]AJY97714.1 hypothetical protein J164_04470 [Xanthomonas citri pv. citri]
MNLLADPHEQRHPCAFDHGHALRALCARAASEVVP